MKTNNGGSVFPGVCHNFTDYNKLAPNGEVVPPGASVHLAGMTMRQYYAAHAPGVPEWFDLASPATRPQLPDPSTLSVGDREQFNSLRNKTMAEENASLPALAHFRGWRAAHDAIEAWERQRETTRFFAWRWFYADWMIATEAGTVSDVTTQAEAQAA